MSAEKISSGFRPVGDPQVVAENPWFTTVRQPMDFVDPQTGKVKRSAADGGAQNYLDIKNPGALIVADLGRQATVLVPQERFTTNLVEGKPAKHYELPGGGFDATDAESDKGVILAAAERELREEAGLTAKDFILLGSKHRGLMAHPFVTDHNYTVLAVGARASKDGAAHEDTEVLGKMEVFSWRQTEDMYLNPDGLWVPESEQHKVISSAPTVASLALAHTWLERQPAEQQHAYVDLGPLPNA